ncbi:STYKc [Musa troglodytarum]|uniref:STYKc n=1 Tax=Musa troglodytarum TaxID=320322 RepID=A0A9E7G5S6_9LILI|nr:STYKc [Musa troglodytarum]
MGGAGNPSSCSPIPDLGQHRGSKYFTSRKKPRKPPPIKVPKLSIEELKPKTDKFDSKALVGEGSDGKEYSTVLNNGKKVAVRKLDVLSEDERNELLTQVSRVSNLKHENFVEMLGYCVEENMLLLAYEDATLGSLHDILHGENSAESGLLLDWTQRLRIALDAAKGLQYLHKEVQPPIIHCDIKSSNVLLFEGFKAKIANYNLLNQSSDVVTRLRSVRASGTPVYHAPECIHKATPKLRKDEFRKCVDPKLEGTYSIRGAAKLAALAALCVQHDVEFRPYMNNVVKILSSILEGHSRPPPDAPPPQPPDA